MNEPLAASLIKANHRGCSGSGDLIPVWNKRLRRDLELDRNPVPDVCLTL